ncbi:hypothetical protein VTK26DRAFT_5303 [Humicola hyalothermophila]
MLVFLLDMLAELFLNSLFHRFASQLPDIHRLGVQDLVDLVLERLDPIIRPLQLLLGLGRGTELALCLRCLTLLHLFSLLAFPGGKRLSIGACLSHCFSGRRQSAPGSSKMAARALASKLMNRIALEDAEEAKVEDAAQVLNSEIQTLLRDEKFLIINFIINHALILVVFASRNTGFFTLFTLLIHCIVHSQIWLLLGLLRWRRRNCRLELPFNAQLVNILFNLESRIEVGSKIALKLADQFRSKLEVFADAIRSREEIPECFLSRV